MAIDLVGFSKMDDRTAMEEAASAGLKSMEHLIRVLSNQTPSQSQTQNPPDCREITDFTVAKFKQLITVLNRTGHARFRRGPMSQSPKPVEPKPHTQTTLTTFQASKSNKEDSSTVSPPLSTTSSFLSSVTIGDGSVSNGKAISSVLAPPAPVFSSGKPPLSQSHRKRCHESNVAAKTSSAGHCHCSKRRRNCKVKRTIRVPAISSKIADIPADEFSWRKYGQKPIKGSPFPRGYYKCSTVRGCPARKHVERAQDDPTMLVVTYEAEHRHPLASVTAASAGHVFASS